MVFPGILFGSQYSCSILSNIPPRGLVTSLEGPTEVVYMVHFCSVICTEIQDLVFREKLSGFGIWHLTGHIGRRDK